MGYVEQHIKIMDFRISRLSDLKCQNTCKIIEKTDFYGPIVFLFCFHGLFSFFLLIFFKNIFFEPAFVENGGVSMDRSVAFGISYRWLVTCDTYHMACYMQCMTSNT